MPSKAELSEFLDPTLPEGTLKRFGHCPYCCKAVGRLGFIVWRTGSGWRVYCHRCGTSRRLRQDGVASPSALISRVNGIRTHGSNKAGTIYLPEDFELEIPNVAKAWLRKYGVTDAEIVSHRFGYSARMNRLILPVFNGEQLVYWQGRKLDNGPGPKYLSMKTKEGGKFFELITPGAKEVVLVEDIVSAICVRRAGFSVVGLLGSYIGDRVAKLLAAKNITKTAVWLDPDKRAEAVRFARKLSGLGLTSVAIVTPTKDPKDYTVSHIRAHLGKGGLRYAEEMCERPAAEASPGTQRQQPSGAGSPA